MKKQSKPKPINWQGRHDKLLSLLFAIRSDVNSGFVDMRMRCAKAEELNRLLEKTKRYEWIKVGEAHHLRPAHEPKLGSVAFVTKKRPGCYEHTIMAKGFATTTEISRTLDLAKEAVEKHFEMLRPSEEE